LYIVSEAMLMSCSVRAHWNAEIDSLLCPCPLADIQLEKKVAQKEAKNLSEGPYTLVWSDKWSFKGALQDMDKGSICVSDHRRRRRCRPLIHSHPSLMLSVL
jgi:hypothetical protein